jgi:hypothetical protein
MAVGHMQVGPGVPSATHMPTVVETGYWETNRLGLAIAYGSVVGHHRIDGDSCAAQYETCGVVLRFVAHWLGLRVGDEVDLGTASAGLDQIDFV